MRKFAQFPAHTLVNLCDKNTIFIDQTGKKSHQNWFAKYIGQPIMPTRPKVGHRTTRLFPRQRDLRGATWQPPHGVKGQMRMIPCQALMQRIDALNALFRKGSKSDADLQPATTGAATSTRLFRAALSHTKTFATGEQLFHGVHMLPHGNIGAISITAADGA